MSNTYATIDQLAALFDLRQLIGLSNDDGSGEADLARIGAILDMQASELDSYLSGYYDLPIISPPLVLTRWVCITSIIRLYGRRSDRPKQLDADEQWASEWIKGVQEGRFRLPDVGRANEPQLLSSDSTDGTSRFDYLFGGLPSRTGTSKGI